MSESNGVESIDMLDELNVVEYVLRTRVRTENHHQGAVAMWGLDKATSMFIGDEIMEEARRREASNVEHERWRDSDIA